MGNEQSNLQKDPDDWVTGDEPMTGAQASYVRTLAQEAGKEATAEAVARNKSGGDRSETERTQRSEVPGDLSKADASKVIDDLQNKTGRGR